jgi:hypothetical protein
MAATAAIADIADMISTIAGILAIIVAFIPVVGTALAGVLLVIAAVAAIVSAVANITLAATGERSWAEAGLAIAGAALSLIGLGGAAKAAMGLAKGISKGAVKQGMKNGWCKFGFGACFVAGTPVLTADGTKPIEDIAVGDKVWTRNLVTGLDELQLVAETFVRQTLALRHLTLRTGVISTTPEHPFMVEGRGWQLAGNLRPGDVLITPDGTAAIETVDVEERDLADIVTVYNFHVENNLNYYVHAGDTPVLVHNNHSKIPKGIKNASKGMKDLFADGSIRGKPIISIRDTLKRDGFTQELAKNKKGYLFRNSNGEEVRVMRRDGAWDVRARNGFGNYLDEFGNVASPGQTHQIGVVSK